MRISRIYVQDSLAVGSKITLDTAASHYLRNVLRLKSDDSVALFNGEDDCDYLAQLEVIGKQSSVSIQSRQCNKMEPVLQSEIIQGLGRADHIDFSIQKCTELGVSCITLFNAEFSQIPLKPRQKDKRLAHWQAIAIKACEQCGRHKPPQIQFAPSINEAITTNLISCKLLLDFDAQALPKYLSSTKPEQQVSLLIGPEGGLSRTEVNLAKAQDYACVSLGPRVLRTETAAIAGLTIVQSIWGDFST